MKRRDFVLALLFASFAGSARGQGKLQKLAILSPTFKTGGHSGLVYEPFLAALKDHGWVAGRNLDIVERFAEDQHERLPALAADIVALGPDVIFTNTGTGLARGRKAFCISAMRFNQPRSRAKYRLPA
jgi:putative ABC transport system substrate-binding protein